MKHSTILNFLASAWLAHSSPVIVGDEAEVKLEVRAINGVEQHVAIPGSTNTGPAVSNSTNEPLTWDNASDPVVPIRGSNGADFMGPQNPQIQNQNPDTVAPPTTDHGQVYNAKWPFALSHNRVEDGGWARQQTVIHLPIATQMAGVNMRLQAGAIRELHWHSASEWAYVLKGSVIVSAVDPDGRNFVGKTNAGDLWFFPAGVPHVLQATDDDPDGAEFLLVFDDGGFDEDSTFLLTDWLIHTPMGVLDKNFGFSAQSTAFSDLPGSQLYIFKAPVPDSVDEQKQDIVSPFGEVPNSYVYALSQQQAKQLSGGSVKIVDSSNFPASTAIAAALVTINPGAIRELHWHPNSDEYSYVINGTLRIGVFAANSNAATYEFHPGDVGYITQNGGTYSECISDTPCVFLEVFKSDHYADIALNQWMALTPVDLIADHLRVSKETIKSFKKEKPVVVAGPTSFF
ncbi:oxalate decarboxylase [Atractiella rhizophila]|nr:oxalate decarboxylase [Atractiella rhizophila]